MREEEAACIILPWRLDPNTAASTGHTGNGYQWWGCRSLWFTNSHSQFTCIFVEIFSDPKLFHNYSISIPELKIIPKHPQMECKLFHLATLALILNNTILKFFLLSPTEDLTAITPPKKKQH
jgi:hypothetical protein